MWQTFAEWEKTICLQNQIANTAGFTLSIRNFESDQHAKYNATQCQVKKKTNRSLSFLYSFIPDCIQSNTI